VNIDLAAVCRAHGISVGGYFGADRVERVVVKFRADGLDAGPDAVADTLEDAVCALLKARYNIGTQRRSGSQTVDGRTEYTAAASGSGAWRSYPTELAAVVALADRLRGEG
jgi:hypothetical protein